MIDKLPLIIIAAAILLFVVNEAVLMVRLKKNKVTMVELYKYKPSTVIYHYVGYLLATITTMFTAVFWYYSLAPLASIMGIMSILLYISSFVFDSDLYFQLQQVKRIKRIIRRM